MDNLLGKGLYSAIEDRVRIEDVNEIRIRLHKPVVLKTQTSDILLQDEYVEESLLTKIINVATGYSRYAHEDEMSDGYLSYGNGLRIGVCGVGTMNERNIIAFRKITSVCIRIPHKKPLPSQLRTFIESFENTLIVGPPYSGKTTLIRSFAEELSFRKDLTLIDERLEIAGTDEHLFSGPRADIIQGIKKNVVFQNVIRSMSPDIIVCDELFGKDDIAAVEKLSLAGIKCLASYHASNKESLPDAFKRIFSRFVFLSSTSAPGTIQSIETHDR